MWFLLHCWSLCQVNHKHIKHVQLSSHNTHTHTHILTCTHNYIHTYTYLHMYTHTCMHAHAHTHAYTHNTHCTHMHAHTHTHMHTLTQHTCTHTCTHAMHPYPFRLRRLWKLCSMGSLRSTTSTVDSLWSSTKAPQGRGRPSTYWLRLKKGVV